MSNSIQDYLRKAADLIDVATHALEAIAKLTKTTADDKAIDVLKAVGAMAETAKAGLKGAVSPQEAKAALADLEDQLKSINDKIDQMIHGKFDVAK